jgi:hypothetical protein
MMLVLGMVMGAWTVLSVLAAACYCAAARNRRRIRETERRMLGIGTADERVRHYGLPYGRRSSLGARTRPSTRIKPYTHSTASSRAPIHIGRRRSHEGVDDREPVRRLPSTGF